MHSEKKNALNDASYTYVIKKMQINPQIIPIHTQKSAKLKTDNTNIGKYEQLELSDIADGSVKWCNHSGENVRSFSYSST